MPGKQPVSLRAVGSRKKITVTPRATSYELRRVSASIDSIAAGVKRLSDGGNANARVIVDELARRGVTINPNSAQAGGAAK